LKRTQEENDQDTNEDVKVQIGVWLHCIQQSRTKEPLPPGKGNRII